MKPIVQLRNSIHRSPARLLRPPSPMISGRRALLRSIDRYLRSALQKLPTCMAPAPHRCHGPRKRLPDNGNSLPQAAPPTSGQQVIPQVTRIRRPARTRLHAVCPPQRQRPLRVTLHCRPRPICFRRSAPPWLRWDQSPAGRARRAPFRSFRLPPGRPVGRARRAPFPSFHPPPGRIIDRGRRVPFPPFRLHLVRPSMQFMLHRPHPQGQHLRRIRPTRHRPLAPQWLRYPLRAM